MDGETAPDPREEMRSKIAVNDYDGGIMELKLGVYFAIVVQDVNGDWRWFPQGIPRSMAYRTQAAVIAEAENWLIDNHGKESP